MRSLIFLLFLFCFCTQQSKSNFETLHVIVATAPESLDPRQATSQVAQQISRLVYVPLFVIGEDLLPIPYVAEKAVQKDLKTYWIYLKPNTVLAEDVVSTYENTGQAEIKIPLEHIRVVNEHIVEIKLKVPYAPLLTDLSGLGIVSLKHNFTGPYFLKEQNRAKETWILEANPNWFQGKPKIQLIEIRVVRDGNTRLLELIKGKADFASGNMKSYQLPILVRYPHVRVQKTEGLDYAYLAMNLRRLPLSDLRVRQAIAKALDVEIIMKTKLQGMATRATGLLPQKHWAKNLNLKPIAYDPQGARELLKQTGHPLPIKLTLLAGIDRFRQSISLILKEQLNAVGFDVHLKVQDWAMTYAQMKQGQFDLYTAIWTPVVEPNLMDWVFNSLKIPSSENAGGNRGAYYNAQVDAWLEEAHTVFDLQKRKKLYGMIETELLNSLPYIPLWFEDNIVVTNRRLQGFVPMRTGSFLPLTQAYLQ